MVIDDLISGLQAINPIITAIADGRQLTFDEAWQLVLFYKHNKDTDEFVEYVEGLPVSDYPALLNDVKMLQSETADLLNTYYNNRSRFEAFDAKAIYHEHLEPMLSAYKAAQDKSVAAYKDYKEIDNSLDMAELRYSKDELEKMRKSHAEKKAYSDESSKRAKELFEVYDRERRRTAWLHGFKLSALVMMVYTYDTMAKALIEDLTRIVGKEDGQ